MDSGTLIMGLFFIAICILPYVLSSLSRKKREKKILTSLSKIAENVNCKINTYDLKSFFAIGADENLDNLFFYKNYKENEVSIHINISEIKSCKVINLNKSNDYKNTETLELSISYILNDKPDVLLEFYNSTESIQLSGELQLIEKWESLINDKLRQRKK